MDNINEIIFIGISVGLIARMMMLKSDYRNYPSYPHEYVTHLSLGLIAAALASLAIPVLLEKQYTAVTFLTLAAQQFRDIRNMERETLSKQESNLLVPRGLDYIEGIAKVFESRNYLVMLASLLTTGGLIVLGRWGGILIGCLSLIVANMLMKGKYVKDIAKVEKSKVHFKESLLMIEDIVIMNVGLKSAKEKILKEGIGVVIHPNDDNSRASLNNLGQRQAILHNVSTLVGSKLEDGEVDFTPLMRKNVDTGALGLFILPNEKDIDCVIEAIYRTPVLESAIQKPLADEVGRKAAD